MVRKATGIMAIFDIRKITDRIKRQEKINILAIVLTVVFFAAAFDVRLHIKHYEITTDQTAETIRIALITDLHSCRYGEEEKKLIRAIDSRQPDLILFGGDICDDILPDDNVESLLKGIAGRYPCYYVTGNHEYWSGRIDDILELFRSCHVTVLNGSCDTIKIGEQTVTICGITDPDATVYTGSPDTKTQLDSLSFGHDPDRYTLLLAHRPELIGLYLQYDFDLILSGHTHGGQWRLPGIVNGLYAPNQGWFPRYAGGMYVKDNRVMIVSRGLARESTKVPRIFNRPELVIVTITPPAEQDV